MQSLNTNVREAQHKISVSLSREVGQRIQMGPPCPTLPRTGRHAFQLSSRVRAGLGWAGLVTEACACPKVWEYLFFAAWQLARGQYDKTVRRDRSLVFTRRQLPALGSTTVPDRLLCGSFGSSEI